MATDELVACWAALVALVDDIHAPQDNLTEAQWQSVDPIFTYLNHRSDLDGDDYLLFVALAVMFGNVDPPDFDDAQWARLEQMRDEYTAKVEANR